MASAMANNNNTTANTHTFGAKCRLAPVERVEREDGMPATRSQFFYTSILPIDDPLSTGSVSGSPETRSGKNQLRPFARGDNNALEKAWLSLMSEDDRSAHKAARLGEISPSIYEDKLAALVQDVASDHWEKHRAGYQPQDLPVPAYAALPNAAYAVCCSELVFDVSEKIHQTFCAVVRKHSPALKVEEVVQTVLVKLDQLRLEASKANDFRTANVDETSSRPGTASSVPVGTPVSIRIPKTGSESRKASLSHRIDIKDRPRSTSLMTNQSSRSQTPVGSPAIARPPIVDDGISGKPFVRVGSPDSHPGSAPSSLSRADVQAKALKQDEPLPLEPQPDAHVNSTGKQESLKFESERQECVEVAVGVSRLHMVSFPMLQMKPIYWSPINDIAVVMRATWFYRLVSIFWIKYTGRY